MKTELTRRLEMALWRSTHNMGTFGCFEVTLGWYGKERVDYMTYNTKGIFRCYEIKVSLADFRSASHNSFAGHYNYYVMPGELYERVKGEIPDGVGVYTGDGDRAVTNVKRAKKKSPSMDIDVLKDSMIRSLCREYAKHIKSGDPYAIAQMERRLREVAQERDRYRSGYHDLKTELHELRHPERVPRR